MTCLVMFITPAEFILGEARRGGGGGARGVFFVSVGEGMCVVMVVMVTGDGGG